MPCSLNCGRFIFKSLDVAFLSIESFICKKKKRKFVIWSQFGRVCNCFRWLDGYMAIKMVAIENCILNSVGKWIFDFVVRNVQSKCQCHECTEVFSFSYIWKHLSCCSFPSLSRCFFLFSAAARFAFRNSHISYYLHWIDQTHCSFWKLRALRKLKMA